MTGYIFEDHEDDGLSYLFRSAYPENIANAFIYAHGCGRLEKTLEKCLNNSSYTDVIVFMDVVPGNLATRSTYYKLKKLAKRSSKAVSIVPLVCAEYYFLKAFCNSDIALMPDIVKDCVDFKPFFNSSIITSEEDIKYCKYFERYCKLVQKKALYFCASSVGDMGRFFYFNDCNSEDIKMSLVEKSFSYLKAYPCIPKGLSCGVPIDTQSVIRQCIVVHNSLCDILSAVDTGDRTYKYIH